MKLQYGSFLKLNFSKLTQKPVGALLYVDMKHGEHLYQAAYFMLDAVNATTFRKFHTREIH